MVRGLRVGTAPLENATLRSPRQLPRSGERCQGQRPAFPGWRCPMGRGERWTLLAALLADGEGETRHAGWTVATVYHMAYYGLSHIMADSRQIMWRKFFRTLCQYSTMTKKVLPHNLAWPFLPFLSSCCRSFSAATLCGRKRLPASKAAPILKHRVLPDNVAPPIFAQIFLGADPKICD